MHIASQSPMADPSSGTVMHLTSHSRKKNQLSMPRRSVAQMPMSKEIVATLPPSDSLQENQKLNARKAKRQDTRLSKAKTSLRDVGGWKPSPSAGPRNMHRADKMVARARGI